MSITINKVQHGPLHLSLHKEDWPVKTPFRITGHTWDAFKVVVVELSDGQCIGRGEGLPIHYLGESQDSI